MSKKSAHVCNKMDLKVIVDGVTVEHIQVHPNMVHLPRKGEEYHILQTETYDTARDDVCAWHKLMVTDVILTHGIVRRRVDGSVSTELLQEASIFCVVSEQSQVVIA